MTGSANRLVWQHWKYEDLYTACTVGYALSHNGDYSTVLFKSLLWSFLCCFILCFGCIVEWSITHHLHCWAVKSCVLHLHTNHSKIKCPIKIPYLSLQTAVVGEKWRICVQWHGTTHTHMPNQIWCIYTTQAQTRKHFTCTQSPIYMSSCDIMEPPEQAHISMLGSPLLDTAASRCVHVRSNGYISPMATWPPV